jgi:hypothetical protein
MYKPNDFKGALWRLGLAALFFWWSWDHWNQISAMEAGQVEKVKMFAPLAWVYNQGGNWAVAAKWTGQVGTVLMGIGALVWAYFDLRPARR